MVELVPPLGANPYPAPKLETKASVRAGEEWDAFAGRLALPRATTTAAGPHLTLADANRASYLQGLNVQIGRQPGLSLAAEADELVRVLGLESPDTYQKTRAPEAPAVPASHPSALETAGRLLEEWDVWIRGRMWALVNPWFVQ